MIGVKAGELDVVIANSLHKSCPCSYLPLSVKPFHHQQYSTKIEVKVACIST